MDDLKGYRGNKGVKGLYQFIINRIPESETLIEAFAGSAQITRKLLSLAPTDGNNCNGQGTFPVVRTVVNDCNPGVCESLKFILPEATVISNLNALQLLSTLLQADRKTFVYCDPPYKISTRSTAQRIYKFEMSDRDHLQFLNGYRNVNFNCMISHYECDLYNDKLENWNREKFKVSYHGKVTEECIYYNYPKPEKLLTYKFVGQDCWDRQRVTRKINRLVSKLNSLPALERNAVIARVNQRLT